MGSGVRQRCLVAYRFPISSVCVQSHAREEQQSAARAAFHRSYPSHHVRERWMCTSAACVYACACMAHDIARIPILVMEMAGRAVAALHTRFFARYMTADIYNEDWVTFGPLAIELQCMRSRTNSKFDMHASEPEHCSCKLRHPHGSRKLPRIETELPQRATGGVRTEQAQDRRLRPLWRCPAYFKQRNLGATGTHPGHKCKSRARVLRAPRDG